MSKKKKGKSMAGEGPSSLNVKVQRKGVVYKLPFRKNMTGSWKKRLFVIKDGYLMYYKAPSGNAADEMTKFDIHPKGVLPLGSTTVAIPEGLKTKPPPGHVAFMVSHPSFIKGNLIAACLASERDAWIDALNNASKVTFENAMEGDKKITELREMGSKKLKEQKNLNKKAKEDAAQVEVLKTKRSNAEISLKDLKNKEDEVKARMIAKEQEKEEQQLEREKVEQELKKVQAKKADLENERLGLETKASEAKMEADEVTKKLEKSRSKAQNALQEAEDAQKNLATEEAKLLAATNKRNKEVESAKKERDRLLATIEKEKKDRLEMEANLEIAKESLRSLDEIFRRKKMADLGLDYDLKNIRGLFANPKKKEEFKTSNSFLVKEGLVSKTDELRQKKRDEARARKLEKRLQETNSIINNANLGERKNEPKEPAAPSSATTAPLEGETKGESNNDERKRTDSAFDSVEIQSLEVDEEEERDSDDSDLEEEDDAIDPEVQERGLTLFSAIDTDGSKQIGKTEFLVALDTGNLEMTDEIKEQLFNAMDRDPPHDDGISEDEFLFYYAAYEDYIRDAFAGYCTAESAPPIDFDMSSAEWYYQNREGETAGPCTLKDFNALFANSEIDVETNVWCEEIDSWRQIGSIEGLPEAFQ